MTLPRLTAEVVSSLAKGIKITDKVSGARIPWVPSAEQEYAWKLEEEHDWLYLAKPRQVYMSTAFCWTDVLWALKCDAEGHKVKCGGIIDTDAKATARQDQCHDFANQLGINVKRKRASGGGADTLRFPGGSSIEWFSGGGNRAGSSLSYHRLHWTEISYIPRATDAYGSIMPSLSHEGQNIIETTMDVKDPLCKALWITDNEFFKHFFKLEDHVEYRRDPNSITGEQWTKLQKEGFTDRSAAAFFMWAVDSICGGDIVQAFHLFPQIEAHLFIMSEDAFIRAVPRVTNPVGTEEVKGETDMYTIEVYKTLEDTCGHVVIGVDTATGKDKDRSAIVVLDKKTREICASFVSGAAWIDDLVLIIERIQKLYTTVIPPPIKLHNTHDTRRVPVAIIEDNGIGEATRQQAFRRGLHVQKHHTTQQNAMAGLLRSKRNVEDGTLFGPEALAEECQDIARDNLGRFTGKKDLLMACGFALLAIDSAPYTEPERPGDDRLKFDHRIDRSGSSWRD